MAADPALIAAFRSYSRIASRLSIGTAIVCAVVAANDLVSVYSTTLSLISLEMAAIVILSGLAMSWELPSGVPDSAVRVVLGSIAISVGSLMIATPSMTLSVGLYGIALGLATMVGSTTQPSIRKIAQCLAFAAGSIALLSAIGHIYGLFGLNSTTGMSPIASILGVAIATAYLCQVPDQGIMATVTDSQAGGIMSRRLLIGIIGIPSVLGLLRLEGESWGLYDTQRGVSLLVVLIIIAFMFMIGRYARTLNTSDESRSKAEAGRVQAENLLQAQRLKAIRSDRLKSLGIMSAGMAHELNQPLVGVRGLAEHLLLGLDRGWSPDDGKIRDRLSLIMEQADRMSHIVEHARMFAREAGKPETRTIDVNEVLASTVRFIEDQFHAQGLVLNVLPSEKKCLVEANPYSLEEVITNLLINAQDATAEAISTTSESERPAVDAQITCSGDQVNILVKDHGTGIPLAIQDQVFEPFFTTKDNDKGTGLGLPICRSIVEQWGGTISIESEEGVGTTVTISLPSSSLASTPEIHE
jgi:signal transduction histidine kinase